VASRSKVPLVLAVLLTGAVATGAAAGILVGAPSAAAPGGSSAPMLSSAAIADVILGMVFVGLGFMIYQRVTGSSYTLSGRVLVTALVGLLVMTGFVVLAHFLSGGGGLFAYTNSTSGNNSSGGSGGVNTTHPVNLTGGGGTTSFFTLTVPTWVPLVALLVIAALIAIFAAPAVSDRLSERREERSLAQLQARQLTEARAALAAAGRALDEGDEPRAVIRTLYARFLDRVAPLVGGVETETPEEIRAFHLLALGIQPSSADALTRLFEEARYSTHPMTSDAAERARSAVRGAEGDLDRRAAGR